MELSQIEGNMNNEVKSLSERTDNRFNELISRMDAGFAELRSEMKELRSEMTSKSEVAAAVAEVRRASMAQQIRWGIAIGAAVLGFIGGAFIGGAFIL